MMNEQEIIKQLVDKGQDESIVSDVVNLIIACGYEVQENDVFMLDFTMRKEINEFLGVCHIASVPNKAKEQLARVIFANFLYIVKSTGKLNINFEVAVKSLSMGDTSTTFADSVSAEQQFDTLLAMSMKLSNEVVQCYRRLAW